MAVRPLAGNNGIPKSFPSTLVPGSPIEAGTRLSGAGDGIWTHEPLRDGISQELPLKSHAVDQA